MQPALSVLEQGVNHLTDACIDGIALDGSAQRFGTDTLLAAAPRIADVGFVAGPYPAARPART